MGRNNRRCLYCGEEYYCCRSCERDNSFRHSCDTMDCYKKLIIESPELVKQHIGIEERDTMAVILRAGLIGGHTIDIVGYDLELGKFDCSDGYTRTFNDFEYFILPSKELQSVGQRLQKMNEDRPKVRVEREQPIVAQPEPTEEEVVEVDEPKYQKKNHRGRPSKQDSDN